MCGNNNVENLFNKFCNFLTTLKMSCIFYLVIIIGLYLKSLRYVIIESADKKVIIVDACFKIEKVINHAVENLRSSWTFFSH